MSNGHARGFIPPAQIPPDALFDHGGTATLLYLAFDVVSNIFG